MINNEKYIEKIETVREVIVDFPKQYKLAKDELSRVEQERQDLLHILEFARLDAVKTSMISRELKDVQRRRRDLKNELEYLNEIVESLKSFGKLKVIENTLNRSIGRLRKISRSQSNRTYNIRIRKDLQELLANERS